MLPKRINSVQFLALYALSIIGCGRTSDPSRTDAGGGGRVGSKLGGTDGSEPAGTGGSEAAGSGGSPPDASTGACTGSVRDFNDQPTPRYEQVQCYVADASNGKPECLPVNDGTLVARLADYIHSSGFVPEFVIDAVDDAPIPEACEPLLSCCAAIAGDRSVWQQQSCYDLVDQPDRANPENCSANFTRPQAYGFTCNGTANGSADNDAGAETSSSTHALCCYRTCGHTHST